MVGEWAQLGEYLRSAREDLKMSIRSVAEKAQISVAYLSRIERGLVGSVSEGVLERIAYALNVDRDLVLMLAGYIPDDYRKGLLNAPYSEIIKSYRGGALFLKEDEYADEIDISFDDVLRAFFKDDPDGDYFIRELSAAYEIAKRRLEFRKRGGGK